MIFLLILAFTTMACFEIPTMVQKQYWRELVLFLFLWLLAFVLSTLYTLGVQLPSPAALITIVVQSLSP
ncbi:hypothetical protein JCM14036_05540 [Desulfotomaculum defluvii]